MTNAQVEQLIASSVSASIPFGMIMAWANTTAPAGWMKLNGASYDPNQYPLLDAYLPQLQGYVQGTLSDWSGHHLAGYGTNYYAGLGAKIGCRAAMPSSGNFGSQGDGSHSHTYGDSSKYGGGTTPTSACLKSTESRTTGKEEELEMVVVASLTYEVTAAQTVGVVILSAPTLQLTEMTHSTKRWS